MLPRMGASAIGYARYEADHNVYWRPGLCLRFTRMCFNVTSKYLTAESAYYGTAHRHTSWPPPPGVPVWWTNGRYGHVAISKGAGQCYSTDFIRNGYVRTTDIKDVGPGWNMTYRGWTEDINGVRVYSPPPPPELSLFNVVRAVRNRSKITYGTLLKKAVADEVGRGLMVLSSPVLGPAFRRRYKRVQAKYLGKTDWHGQDGIPGRGSLSWLGRRRGFRVKE